MPDHHSLPRIVALVLVALAAAGCDDPAAPGPGQPDGLDLVLPIGGAMNRDWYVTNYVDRVASGVGDYACGVKSYDGHNGIDLVLPSFAAMDAGVAVVAAAPGTVVWTIDGHPDRNVSWDGAGEWNAVGIDHGGGHEGWYGHLMRNSVRVGPGERVAAGDTLGLVGSSGRSDMPHLHFELRHQGVVRDPFAGPCGEAVGQWADPIEYQDDFHLIDAGVTTTVLTSDPALDDVKDPPPPAGTIAPGERIYAWVHYHNVPAGAETRWTIRGPDGSVAAEYAGTHPRFWSMSWWWYYRDTGDFTEPGTWSVEFSLDGEPLATRPFTVTPVVAAPEARVAAPARQGIDGGGIR